MDFKSRYRRECLITGTSPLNIVEARLADAILKFKFLLIPLYQWNPILSALKSTFTLKKIAVMIDVDLTINKKIHKIKLNHLHSFMEKLSIHLSNSQVLTRLELVGLPFTNADIEQLRKGILNSDSLRHICLSGSKIFDEGLINIFEAIKTKPNIVWLDLSNCCLLPLSGKSLASLIHFQAVARENAALKASLIEENPNLDLMGGLRRLSLSGSHLCHDAVRHIAASLYEDRWIKAIDLQFCDLENTHINQLIRAAENNQSLIHIDISNNKNLNSEVLKKLEEVLKYNSKQPTSFVFESINLPKHHITSFKELNPFVKSKVNSLNKTKLSKDEKLAEVKSTDQITNSMTDLLQERKLRNNAAEQQVIQIYSEMESARTRIAKLEEEVKHLGSKQKKLSVKSILPDRTKVFENNVSYHSITQCFLKQLQDVLKELKITTSVARCSNSKDQSQEIQDILDSVYAAVREFAPKVQTTSASYPTIKKNKCDKRLAEHCRTELPSSIFSDRKPEKTGYCENLLDKTLRDFVTTTEDGIQISAIVKNAASFQPKMVFDAAQKNDTLFVNEQDSSRVVTNNFNVNSLKNLQSNLEEIMQELSKQTNDASSNKMYSRSQLTISGNLSDLTNQETELHYSMDFDSFCTSIKSISNNSKDECRLSSSKRIKPPRHFCSEEHDHFSSSSSSLKLSSIVDLLGNLSVDDIGESTLTPP